MPIYEYRCSRCEHEFEVWQKMSDPPVKVCPKCHAHKVEKLVSLSSFQLKGSGWYATDYGSRKAGGAGKHSRSEAKSESSGADSKPSAEKSSESGKGDKGGGEKAGDKAGDKGGDKGGKAASGTGGTPRLAAAAA